MILITFTSCMKSFFKNFIFIVGSRCNSSSPCADYCKNKGRRPLFDLLHIEFILILRNFCFIWLLYISGKCKLSNNNLQGSSPLCDCLPGYSGETCEDSVCDNKQCENGGTCFIGQKL